jgi:hypothetical protein
MPNALGLIYSIITKKVLTPSKERDYPRTPKEGAWCSRYRSTPPGFGTKRNSLPKKGPSGKRTRSFCGVSVLG